MSEIEIVILSPEDWAEYKRIRLEALQDSPQAYGRSYNETVGETDEFWKEKMKDVQDGKRVRLFARLDGEIVGVVSGSPEHGEKLHHRVHINETYISPKARGKGAGKMLMQAIIEEFKKKPEVIVLSLNVAVTQKEAQKLYESLGFKIIGHIEKDINVNGTFYDTEIMELFIR